MDLWLKAMKCRTMCSNAENPVAINKVSNSMSFQRSPLTSETLWRSPQGLAIHSVLAIYLKGRLFHN